MLIATDIGGTFTDLVAYDPGSGAVYHAKSHTDPADFTAGPSTAGSARSTRPSSGW